MKFNKWVIVLILFSFTTICSLSAQTDSLLLQKIDKAKGERKLELILELADIYANTEKLLDISKQIEQEAKSQKNMEYLAKSYHVRASYYMITSSSDSVIFYVRLADQTYDKYNIKNTYLGYYYLSILYLNMGCYDLAIYNLKYYLKNKVDKANDIDAYNLLGIAYILSEEYDLAQENLEKAISLFKLRDDDSSQTLLRLYDPLAGLFYYKKEYDKALEICVIMEDFSNRNEKILPEAVFNLYQFRINLIYAGVYIGMRDTEKSKSHIDKSKHYADLIEYEAGQYELKGMEGEYYALLKEYDKALAYFDESLLYFREKEPNPEVFFEITRQKIDVLKIAGRLDEALELQSDFIHYKDSVSKKNIPLQISELSKSYELEKASIEKVKDKIKLERSQMVIIALLIITILLISILYIVRRNTKSLKEKNKMLYKQREEVDAYIKMTKSTVSTTNAEEILSKESSIFNKLELYMNEEEAFRNCELNREEIASILGTNRQYLADAVKAETGKTFMDYINNYRLDYARRLLIIDNTIPVTYIIRDSGFSSNTTFYRLFKEKFGMSPNELRKIKVEIEKGII
ncbi:AraC family transcriptional regulator [Dysgonomonas sp. Marseille-P4361]|uniref:AraC family transcriptional regulator n=1 Tax=Dysgonomonas sp. Marseille-P4361 TaxID=2161820 RepID=UPI00135CB7B8|nr:AraC family transcriptional regulator [Dysgonomonas sp. Marseille-P4361]